MTPVKLSGGRNLSKDFAARAIVRLDARAACVHPPELPELVHLDSPAIEVMTDFNHVWPVSVAPQVAIDKALSRMKTSGVRLLLVMDADRRILGVISAVDILGERPIQLVEESRIQRGEITVEAIMTPQERVDVLDMRSVQDARVGHILETLRELERQHILVVEHTADGQRVRGLFSTSQIYKQLGFDPSEELPAAHSLAEMVHERELSG